MRLPFFPLRAVFFPGETVPLHIFEERYKQLIRDCRAEAGTFGIPVYHNKQIAFGTEVQLVEIVTTYQGGEMDIVCVGRQVFRVISFERQAKGKLYAAGEVEFLDNVNDGALETKKEVLLKLGELYDLMGVARAPVSAENFNSYALAHKMGLSAEQEYRFLQLARESDRLHYINAHLIETIRVLNEVNHTRQKIEMNGHYRNFDPLDFRDFRL
jgi:Lon protease-like protein